MSKRLLQLGLRLGFAMAALALPGCRDAKSADDAVGVERRVMLLGESDEPAFFLRADRDAPAVGFGSADAKLIVRGPAEQGRVPVRVHGRVSLEAYVPQSLLELRAQTTARVAGAPVMVGPNDRLRVLGPAAEPGRVRVAARLRLGADVLGPFEGTLPLASLAANEAPEGAAPPQDGLLYTLAAGRALPLFDAPQGELIALVPAQPEAMTASVFAVEQAWLGVRVGGGPYLVGYTNQPLMLQGEPSRVTQRSAAPAAAEGIPRRILETQGALKRLASGARLHFRGLPIAKFRSEGWARVLGQGQHGLLVDVLAAADDQVTVRGLALATDLREPDRPGDATSMARVGDTGLDAPAGPHE